MTRKMTDVLKAMNEMPEEWIEHCYEVNGKTVSEENNGNDTRTLRFRVFGKNAVKWVAAAAAAILLCGGGVAYAAKLGVLQFTRIKDETKQGWNLRVETERISAEELTGDIREAEAFLRDYMAEENYSQTYPSWLKQFETVEEAKAYIGYAGMKETLVPGTVEEVNVRVIGDTDGNLGEVSLFVRSVEGDISLNETAAVFTEECPLALHGTGVLYLENFLEKEGEIPEYRSEEYTTAGGKTAVLVYEENVAGNRFLVGAVADGAMYYELSVLYYPQDFERAKEIVRQWCEQF